MIQRVVLLCGILLHSGWLQAETESELQRRIDAAIRSGGGEIVIPPGEFVIQRGLMLKDARHIRISAMDRDRTVLRLAPMAFAETAVAAKPGEMEIRVSRAQHLTPGMQLHIEADGAIDAFTKKPKPYQLAVLKSAETSRLLLKSPLEFPVPAGTLIRHADAPNLFEIRGASEDIRIDNLTIDGGLSADMPIVRGHAQLCGVFAQGPYNYEKGPTGPPIKNVRVTRCTIRNCFGRGVALYSVIDSVVESCSIADTNDEAIDLDHFTFRTVVRGNRLTRCLAGVELNDATDCVIENNIIRDCRTGVHIWRWCKQPGLNERNRIARNTIIDTLSNAVQLSTGTEENIVTDNTIQNAGRNGISLGGNRQTITQNRITGVKLKKIAINEGEHTIEDADLTRSPP